MWSAVAVADEDTVVPSPKSNAYVRAWPCGSVDADASAVSASGAAPLAGVTVNEAAGGWTAGAVVTTVAVVAVLRPLALVTVTVAVNVPTPV